MHTLLPARHCGTASRSRDCLYTLIQKTWETWVSAASMEKNIGPLPSCMPWLGKICAGNLRQNVGRTSQKRPVMDKSSAISLNLDSNIAAATVTVVQIPWWEVKLVKKCYHDVQIEFQIQKTQGVEQSDGEGHELPSRCDISRAHDTPHHAVSLLVTNLCQLRRGEVWHTW